MKLKTSIFGQRDSRWSNVILGYNKEGSAYTIGMYGCLIACLGMYIDKNPNEVNQILKDNGGFTAGSGLFIWSKCTALGLNQTYVSPEYTGPVTPQGITKIRELLDQGLPLLCEIDFNPATTKEEMHFVLLTGYDGDRIFAADPWTGKVIDLDVYGGATRAIIQFRAYDKKLDKEGSNELDVCLADRLKFWEERDSWIEKYKDLDTKYVLLLGEKQRTEKERDVCLTDKTNLIETSSNAIEALNKQNEQSLVKIKILEEKIAKLEKQINTSDDEKQIKINSLTTENKGLVEKIKLLEKEKEKIRIYETILEFNSFALIKFITKN